MEVRHIPMYTAGIVLFTVGVSTPSGLEMIHFFIAAPIEIALRPLVGQVWVHDWVVRATFAVSGLFGILVALDWGEGDG